MPFDFLIHKMFEARSVSLTLLFFIKKLEISERFFQKSPTSVTQYIFNWRDSVKDGRIPAFVLLSWTVEEKKITLIG